MKTPYKLTPARSVFQETGWCVCLQIDHQSFEVGKHLTRSEARWLEHQLAVALDRMLEKQSRKERLA